MSAPILVIKNPDGATSIVVPGSGALIVHSIGGRMVVEAIAISEPGDPRPIVQARHARLLALSRDLFGADLEYRDPLGLTGGKSQVVS